MTPPALANIVSPPGTLHGVWFLDITNSPDLINRLRPHTRSFTVEVARVGEGWRALSRIAMSGLLRSSRTTSCSQSNKRAASWPSRRNLAGVPATGPAIPPNTPGGEFLSRGSEVRVLPGPPHSEFESWLPAVSQLTHQPLRVPFVSHALEEERPPVPRPGWTARASLGVAAFRTE